MTLLQELKLQYLSLGKKIAELEANETASKKLSLQERGWTKHSNHNFQNSDGLSEWYESWDVYTTSALPKELTWEEITELEEQGIVELVRIY